MLRWVHIALDVYSPGEYIHHIQAVNGSMDMTTIIELNMKRADVMCRLIECRDESMGAYWRKRLKAIEKQMAKLVAGAA